MERQEPTAVDWARLAAFIDGEGAIGIKVRRRGNNCQHVLSVRVHNTDIRLVSWIQDKFSGRVAPARTKGNRKLCFYWEIRDRKAELVIERCFDYFIVKRERAEIALALRTTFRKPPQAVVSQSVMEQREEFRSKLRVMNMRGTKNEAVA